jgi:16S rRNA C967 or C1407 C5-methylase (RsmB/RsmF family)
LEKRVLPNKFQDYLLEAAGSDRAPIILDALESTEPSLSIRINPLKPLLKGVDSVVNEAIALGDKVPWCPDGYYLPSRPNFTLDPALHAGAYYVQEPSSMFLALIKPLLADISNPRVLDLCAAPGGKTTHLVSMLPLHSYIVANEVVKNRVAPLKENLLKWGNHSVEVTSKDAREISSYCNAVGLQFDFILVDAPCSGEGMFRKDPVAISEWSEENVKTCAARQKRILSDIWPTLAPGGYLAYSTCTFNIYENDQNVIWLQQQLGAHLISLEELYHNHFSNHSPDSATHSPDTIIHSSDSATSSSGSATHSPDTLIHSSDTATLSVGHLETMLNKSGVVKGSAGGYRLFPGLVRGEGLFFALFRKEIAPKDSVENAIPYQPATISSNHLSSKQLSAKQLSKQQSQQLPSKQQLSKQLTAKQLFNQHSKQQSQQLPSKQQLSKQLIQEIHNPEDALSITGSNDIPRFELSKDIALKYLARQSITLQGAPLGYLIVTYGGLPLGYVKNLGTRANNLYPINWRIRKDFGSV